MTPSLVVLTDFFAVTNRALSYAAGLAVPLHAELVLLHVRYDGLPVPAGFGSRHTPEAERKTDKALLQLAASQTVPTEVDVADSLLLPEALAEAVRRHRPLFIVLGRLGAANEAVELFSNAVTDVLRHAPYPLLVVPPAGWDAFPPRRLLLAVDGQPFTLRDGAGQEALSRLLQATGGTLDLVHVSEDMLARAEEGAVLQTVRDSDLVGGLDEGQVHDVFNTSIVDGVLQEAARQQADMLVVIARRHSILGSFFHSSTTAELLQQSPIPVLVLPALD